MEIEKFDDLIMDDAAKSLLVQRNQTEAAEQRIAEIWPYIASLSKKNDATLHQLDQLINQAEALCQDCGFIPDQLPGDGVNNVMVSIDLTKEEKDALVVPLFAELDIMGANDVTWEEYIAHVENFAQKHEIDLQQPFDKLLTMAEKADLAQKVHDDYTMQSAKCDKYDYLIASFCGIVAGVIDSLFVGMPNAVKTVKDSNGEKSRVLIENSKLGTWTDKKTDDLVKIVARKQGWAPSLEKTDSVASAIGFLERKYTVNYDQSTTKEVFGKFDMSKKNHHIKSLSHAPDLIGLVFSILDQFTAQSHFIANGQVIVINSDKKLEGSTFRSKLFCGFVNWFGHVVSDIAGSSGSRGKGEIGRGSGLSIPFYELFQFCDFGSFKVYKGDNRAGSMSQISFSELAVKIYEHGYDARFSATMAIPVLLNDILISLLWSIKSVAYHKNSIQDSLPFGNHPELRRMLLTGHGVLCAVDTVDAAARSQGQILFFALHLNLIAWERLAFSGLIELRALYKENALDLHAMDEDLALEWKRLYNNHAL